MQQVHFSGPPKKGSHPELGAQVREAQIGARL